MQTEARTWRYDRFTCVLIAVAAAFLAGIALLIIALPWVLAGDGDPGPGWTLDLCGSAIFGIASFMLFGVIAMLRTRIRLAGTVLDATVADGHNALLVPHFRTIALDVATLRSVEKRQEIVRSFWLSNLRESISIVTASGERIGLVSATYGVSVQFPVEDAAAAIAAAAHLPLTDDGTVRSTASGLYGAASSAWTERPMDPEAASKARRTALLTTQIIFGLFVLTTLLRACA